MRENRARLVARVGLIGVMATLGALVLTGCAGVQTQPPTAGPGAATQAASTGAMTASGSSMKMDKTPDPTVQKCSACITGKEPTPTAGTVEDVSGAQVVHVGIVGGYFTPNRFKVKAGTPVKVVFKVDGKPASGCVSKPTFKSLNKTVTVTQGEQTLELGALTPGTYEFGCAMGANKGSIVVQ
jgi:hypothetical protein